jgi:hypothetical protein
MPADPKKRKKIQASRQTFIVLFESAHTKDAHKMFVKSTPVVVHVFLMKTNIGSSHAYGGKPKGSFQPYFLLLSF